MELEFVLDKPIQTVFEHLADMRKFVAVHPVIYKIDSLDNNNYLIYERLKLGFIPWSFRYPATVNSQEADRIVHIKANVMKLVEIDILAKLTELNGKTQVKETITFNTFLPVGAILTSVFRTQHGLLFSNINKIEIA